MGILDGERSNNNNNHEKGSLNLVGIIIRIKKKN